MENEEKKVSCCEGKEKCEHGMMHCCHNWRKCHMMKWIIVIVALIIAFCMGTQWGEMHSGIRGDSRFERGGMMNWGYNQVNPKLNSGATTTGTVTVDVNKTTETPN